MKSNKIFFSLAAALCVIAFAGCSRQPQLTVRNQSSSPLSNLVVSGTGFSQNLGALAPGKQKRIGVSPSGESGLQVEFDAAGKHYSAKLDCYFENNSLYRVTATVATDFSVKGDVSAKGY